MSSQARARSKDQMEMTWMISTLTENFPLVVIAVVVIILSSTNLTPAHRILTAFLSRLYLNTVIASRQKQATASNSEVKHGTVSGLFFHPVKSLKAVSCDSIKLDTKGFVNDRNIMIVAPMPLPVYNKAWDPDDVTYRFMSQRQCPTLATVTAKLDADTNKLTLSSPVLKDISITVSTSPSLDAPVYRAKLWEDDVLVHDLGDAAAAFIQQIFNRDKYIEAGVSGTDKVRLAIQSPIDKRLVNDKYTPASARTVLGHAPPVSLSDGFPILIACETSLDELNRRIMAKNGGNKNVAPLPMSRFRPNIVIKGTKEPFEEDRWKVISIDGVLFHIVKGCPRCKQSCTDQNTGVVHDEPLTTLSEFRAMTSRYPENLYFATNAIPAIGSEGKTISVGAKVQVLQWGAPQWDE